MHRHKLIINRHHDCLLLVGQLLADEMFKPVIHMMSQPLHKRSKPLHALSVRASS